jgi:nucleoside-diphosphate-sugar epimerase
LHMKPDPQHDTYHLSSGNDSQTFQELTKALAAEQTKRAPMFVPILENPFDSLVKAMANRKGAIGHGAALLKVFMPYLTWNTVFDNTRVTAELGRKPALFSEYSFPLLRFSREHNFEYPYRAWPESTRLGGSAA